MKKRKNIILEKARSNKEEFMAFFRENNVIGLAIGIVIGNAVRDLVTAVVDDLIMPIVGIVTPNGAWRQITVTLMGAHFNIGNFLSSFLDFFIIVAVAYIFMKKILRIGNDERKL